MVIIILQKKKIIVIINKTKLQYKNKTSINTFNQIRFVRQITNMRAKGGGCKQAFNGKKLSMKGI